MQPTTCEEFEIAVERKLHGASTPEEDAALARHLATCERCGAYAEQAARTRSGLSTLTLEARGDVRWGTLETRLRRHGWLRVRRTMLLAGSVGFVTIALATWGLSAPGRRLEHTLVQVGVVVVIVAVRIAGLVRRARHADRIVERTDFFALYRKELASDIRRITRARWIALVLVVAMIAFGALAPHLTPHGRAVFYAFGAIVAGVWTQRLLVGLPHLRRELAALDQGNDG